MPVDTNQQPEFLTPEQLEEIAAGIAEGDTNGLMDLLDDEPFQLERSTP